MNHKRIALAALLLAAACGAFAQVKVEQP